MKMSSDHFVNIKCDIEPEDSTTDTENRNLDSWQDPLCGIGNEVQSFYRVDSIVFAEPITTNRQNSENCKEECTSSSNAGVEEIFSIDNVIVQKSTVRKNNKYLISIEDTSKPTCPQSNCKRSFSTLVLLKAHIRKVHCADRTRFICERCGAGFPAGYLLRRHTAVHENRQVECPVCHKMLSERTNLSVHLNSHADSRSHQCPICRKRFLRKATLNVHVKFVHRQGDLMCDKCDARFTSRVQWSRHKASHVTQ